MNSPAPEQKNSELRPPPLTIGDVTARLPIIQGGMGVGVSMSGLATAVARAGGIGVLAAVLIGINEKDFMSNPTGGHIPCAGKADKGSKGGCSGRHSGR